MEINEENNHIYACLTCTFTSVYLFAFVQILILNIHLLFWYAVHYKIKQWRDSCMDTYFQYYRKNKHGKCKVGQQLNIPLTSFVKITNIYFLQKKLIGCSG